VVAQLDASLEGMSDVWQRCLSRLFEDFVPHAVGKGGLPNGKLLEDAQQLAVLKSLEGSQGFTCRVERVRKVRPRFGRGSGRGGSARFGGGSEASAIQGTCSRGRCVPCLRLFGARDRHLTVAILTTLGHGAEVSAWTILGEFSHCPTMSVIGFGIGVFWDYFGG
jgi:hypothetical protein